MKKKIFALLIASLMCVTSSFSSISALDLSSNQQFSDSQNSEEIEPRYKDTHLVYVRKNQWVEVCSDRPVLGEQVYACIASVDQNCTADEFEMKLSTSFGGDQTPVSCPIGKWKTIGGINALIGTNKWTLYVRGNGSGYITITVKDDTDYND